MRKQVAETSHGILILIKLVDFSWLFLELLVILVMSWKSLLFGFKIQGEKVKKQFLNKSESDRNKCLAFVLLIGRGSCSPIVGI